MVIIYHNSYVQSLNDVLKNQGVSLSSMAKFHILKKYKCGHGISNNVADTTDAQCYNKNKDSGNTGNA